MKKLLLLTIALLFAATSAWAVTNRYVPCDLNTLHVPCYATIQAAIDASSTGDIIIVAAGTYNEYVTVNKSVTLNGANAGIHPAVGTSPTDVVGTRGPETILSSLSPAADNITIDGFEFLKAGTRIIDTYSNANGFTLKNCIVESTVNGPSTGIIQFGGGSHINCTFQYDLFQDLGDHTFYAAGGPYDNLKFQYNKFQSKIDAIFWSATALTGGIIDHNEFDGQSGADNNDINIGLAGNLQVTNNLFHDILYTAIQVGIINGSISGNTFNNYYGLSGSTSAAIQLWGGEWGTPVSTNVSISNNIINYNQQGVGVGPVFGIRLRGPNSPSDPAIDGSTIHIHNNAFYNGGVRNDAFAILFQGNQATSVDAICNWFASVATPNVFQTPIFPSPVTFIPYSISNGGSCTGSGIITNIQPPTSVSGSCSNYDVQITVQNFTNVGSISLRLLYDPAVFTYQSFTPNAAIHSAWGDGSTPGLFILGDDNDLATLPNDAVLFTLHFTLLPAISGNTTNLTWGSNQGDNEYGGPLGPGGSPTYVSEFNPETWTISSGRPVLNFTRGYWYCTIQDAIDASTTTTGDIIKVYPGTYNRDEANGWNYLTGLPGTSNFNIFVNKQLTIEGVDASGNPITNAGSIAAYVIPENDTPPGNLSTIFVQADNVTIQGLDITALNDQNYDYKTISVIGNNCTIQDCNIHALDQVSCIYMYDPRYDATTNTSHIQSYTFDHNIFDPGGVDASGIRFSSGPGWSGPVATRIITYNTFTGGSYSIEFVGPGGDTWDTYPVGAATITHNSFTGADRGSVVAWGQYGTAEGYGTIDWYGILNSNNNTFDKAVITLIPPTSPYNVRSYFTTYSDGDGDHNFYNLRGIYSAIQKYPINHVAQSGDIVEVFSGTYDEQVVVNGLDITIEGAGNSTIIKPSLPTKLTTFYTYPFGTFWPGAILAPIVLVENSGSGNVILHNFEVDGVNVSSLPVGSERLAGILYGESSGTINNVTVTTVKTSGYADRSYGIDLSAVSGTHAVDVENCNITDWARNGIQAMGVSLTANIHDNILVGPGTIGPDNVPNGIVFIHGVGGYATTNTISACHYNSATWGSDGILVYDPVASGISIQYNHVSNCDVGVGVSHNANYATIDQNDLIGNIVGAQIDDGATNNTFTENNIVNNTVAGIFIDGTLDPSPGNPPGSGNVAHQNNISANTMNVVDYDKSQTFVATCNWWGSSITATIAGKITGSVTYVPWLSSGVDNNPALTGFQTTSPCGPCDLSISCPAPIVYCGSANTYVANWLGIETLDQQATAITGPESANTATGQSFTVGTTGLLTKLTLSFAKAGSFTLHIFDGNGVSGCELMNKYINTITSTGNQDIILSQTEAPYLVATHQYTFWLTWSNNQDDIQVNGETGSTDYSGGEYWEACSGCPTPESPTAYPGSDLYFIDYITPIPNLSVTAGSSNITTVIPDHISGSSFGIGTTTVTYTATDCSGCTATCSFTVKVHNFPSAPTSGGDKSICSGQTIPALTVTVGTGETADWYSAPSNGTLLASGTLSYTPTAAGTYYAEARNIVYTCVSATRTAVTLTVNALPIAGAITGNSAVCMGSTLQLTSNATGTATLTYTWASSAPGVATVTNTGLVTTVAPGTTNITYTVTDGSSTACQATSASFTVTVNARPTSVMSGTTTICNGGSTNLSITFSGIAPFVYSINGGTQVTAVTNPEIVSVSPSSTTTYIVTSLHDANCTASEGDMTGNAVITVNPLPTVSAAVMQYSINPSGGPWTAMNGTFPSYSMCLDPSVLWYYLDIDTYTQTPALLQNNLNPFNLVMSSVPSGWFTYWAGKGITSTSPYPYSVLWNIINGTQPIFYIYETGGDYQLIDGYTYLTTSTFTPLKVEGLYPAGSYVYNGTVKDVNGCVSLPFNVNMQFTTDLPVSVTIAANNNPVCIGTQVTFTATPTNGGTPTYQWYVGTNAVGTGSTYTYAPANGDQVKVVMTSTIACETGSPATSNVITMTVIPTAAITSVSGQTPLCINGTATYTTLGVVLGGGTGAWSTSNALVATVNATGTVTAVGAGTCDIIYTITNGCGGTVFASQSLTVNPNAAITSVTGTSPLCIGVTTTYTANGVVLGGNGSGAWSTSNGSIATVDATGSVTAVAAGTCNITYTITGGCGGTVSASHSLTVNPNAAITSVTGTSPLCIGVTTTYTANGVVLGGNGSGAWSTSNGSIATVDATGSVTAVAAGTCNITYTITGGCGGTVSASHSLTVNPNAAITSVTGTSPLCIGATTTYTANGVVLGGNGSGAWSTSDGSVATVNQTGLVTAVGAGTCNITYTITNGCGGTVAASQSLLVNPNLPVSVSLAGDYNPVCSGTTVNFTATPTNEGSNPGYAWYVNGNQDLTASGNIYSYVPTNGNVVEVQLTSNITPCATGNPATSSMTMTVNPCDITGTLTYDNAAYTGLTGMTVTLNSTPSHSSLATVAGGAYTISNVPSGTYTISVNANLKPVGGINATDAAQVNYYGVGSHPYLIDMVRWFAGDVNNDTWIDPTDASLILGYFVMNGNSPYTISPKWKFWLASGSFIGANYTGPTNPSVTISSSTISNENLYGMCNGDFNQSFIPAAKEGSNSLSLTYGATIQVKTGDEFDLPLSTQSAIDVGAVSLILNFPSDKLEIMGVTLADQSSTPVMYNVSGNELRIGWYSREDLSLKAGDKLLTLRVKLLASLDQSETIRFTLAGDQLNELADAMADVIPDAVLNIDLVGSALGINPGSGTQTLNFTNYPNPFTGTTTLAYSLPANGAVTIELRNTLGVLDKVIVNNVQQTSGDYKLVLDGNNLPDGVYMATLKLISADQTITRTIKIVRTY